MNIKLSMNSSMVMPGWEVIYISDFFLQLYAALAFQRPQVYIYIYIYLNSKGFPLMKSTTNLGGGESKFA